METLTLIDACLTADLFFGGTLKSPVNIAHENRLVAVLIPAEQYQADQQRLKAQKERISYLESGNGILVDAYESLQAKLALMGLATADLDKSLVESLVYSGGETPCPGAAGEAAPDLPDLNQPLTVHNLATPEGRFAFLWCFYEGHSFPGLLAATSHVWSSLGRPKAARSEAMAAKLGLPGKGKSALRRALKRFLEEVEEAMQTVPDIPNLADFPDFDTWNAVCKGIFKQMDERYEPVALKYEAILDGREPPANDPSPPDAVILHGPWTPLTGVRSHRRRKPE